MCSTCCAGVHLPGAIGDCHASAEMDRAANWKLATAERFPSSSLSTLPCISTSRFATPGARCTPGIWCRVWFLHPIIKMTGGQTARVNARVVRGEPFVSPRTPIDLTNCDREPIHLPGAIQPHGALLGVDEADGRIKQVSRNA